MNSLRNIIVTATSEMLDEPGKHGIYKTTRFYDRLESEITEYMKSAPTPVDIHDLIVEIVKNSASISIPMQNAIARYLDFLSNPQIVLTNDFKDTISKAFGAKK